jgi:hypothetical protein
VSHGTPAAHAERPTDHDVALLDVHLSREHGVVRDDDFARPGLFGKVLQHKVELSAKAVDKGAGLLNGQGRPAAAGRAGWGTVNDPKLRRYSRFGVEVNTALDEIRSAGEMLLEFRTGGDATQSTIEARKLNRN